MLRHSRWRLLTRPAQLTGRQIGRLRELVQDNLRSVRAYLQREDFQRFWQYRAPAWAGRFLDERRHRVSRSRQPPMQKAARNLRKHRALLLNWIRAQGAISAGIVESCDHKARLTTRRSYGFRDYETVELALYHQFGRQPQPKTPDEFC